MPFVTKISFSSGDRDVLAETVERIRTLLDKKGADYNGPHSIPAETVTVPLYQQLRVGEEFSSWEPVIEKSTMSHPEQGEQQAFQT